MKAMSREINFVDLNLITCVEKQIVFLFLKNCILHEF